MLDQKTQTQEEADLWNEVNNPPEKTFDLFGQLVDLNIFKGAYQSGTRGAVPYDPQVHQKAQTIVRFYIQPLPEINVTYTNQLTYESVVWGDWGKITFPSIKALGIADAREINNKWFRFARVPNGKTYPKSDGTTGEEKTWKIVEVYTSEDECRAAYIKDGGKSNGHNTPVQVASNGENTEKATAYQFLKVIVANAARGKETFAQAQEAVGLALQQYPAVSKFYLANSPETGMLITETTKLLPF